MIVDKKHIFVRNIYKTYQKRKACGMEKIYFAKCWFEKNYFLSKRKNRN